MLKDEVLSLLEKETGKYISGGVIAAQLGVTRGAIWKAVEQLRAEGYKIDSGTNRGYSLSAKNDILSPAGIKALLKSDSFIKDIIIEKKISSTNSVLKEKAAAGAPEGTVLIAREQSGGRGRMGRNFASAPGGLYMSVILKPSAPASKCPVITAGAALAVCEAIDAAAGIFPKIKWVNDIMYYGKKLCGILTESALEVESGHMQYAVLGIGVNVRPAPLPEQLKDTAVFLNEAAGREISLERLAAGILNKLDDIYSQIFDSAKKIILRYEKRLMMLGQKIEVINGGDRRICVPFGVDEEARLIVTEEDGTQSKLFSGEISTRVVI